MTSEVDIPVFKILLACKIICTNGLQILVKAAAFLSNLRVDELLCYTRSFQLRTVKALAEFLFAQGKSRSSRQGKENNPLSLKNAASLDVLLV